MLGNGVAHKSVLLENIAFVFIAYLLLHIRFRYTSIAFRRLRQSES